MHQDFGKLRYSMPTLEQTWKSSFPIDAFDTNMLLPKDNDISDDHQISVADLTYNIYKGSFVLVIMDHAEDTFKDTNQPKCIFLCLTLERNPKYWFTHLKLSKPTKENFTNDFFFHQGDRGELVWPIFLH